MSRLDALTGAILEAAFVEVEASGRHVHLTEADAIALFGHGLTPERPLSQPGQFVCSERVTLAGPKGEIGRVAVLGPARPESQVEISRTDARALGIRAPVRLSGDIAGTPGIRILGARGDVTLEKGVLIARRHIHMTPQAAARYGVADGDEIRVRCLSERPLVLEGVAVRVSRDFANRVHIDLDEANACGHQKGDLGVILRG